MNKHTAVVILEHWRSDRDREMTNACLESLSKQAGFEGILPVVFLNNVQSQQNPHFLADYPVPVISPEKPCSVTGFIAEAHRTLLKQPEIKFMVAANNDVLFENHLAILELIQELVDPKVGVVAAGTNDRGAGWLFTDTVQDVNIIVPHVDNHCWAFRLDIFSKVGYPRQVGHWADWYSNIDYCWRLRKNGFLVKAVLKARVLHSGGSYGKLNPDGAKQGWDWFCQQYPDAKERKIILGEV